MAELQDFPHSAFLLCDMFSPSTESQRPVEYDMLIPQQMRDMPPSLEGLKGKKGTYALLFQVEHPIHVRIGKLGPKEFAPGMWVYVGSAMGTGSASLGQRLQRHFSNSKKKHWHIDFLLSGNAHILGALWIETEKSFECGLASALRDSRVFEAGPSGFGSTDCRERCGTHLFRYIGCGDLKTVRVALRRKQASFLNRAHHVTIDAHHINKQFDLPLANPNPREKTS